MGTIENQCRMTYWHEADKKNIQLMYVRRKKKKIPFIIRSAFKLSL